LLPIAVVVALKVADAAPAATMTDAGTVRVELLLARVTLALVGAGCVKVTVQVLEAFGPRLIGLHESDDTSTGAITEETDKLIGDVEVPFRVAETITI
jgi:hypothetical protein